jgi:cellulose biosynthesis protein BcsQ
VVLVDTGPNLGALNRSALMAADHVVTLLVPDLFNVRGLRELGAGMSTMSWPCRLLPGEVD